MTTAVLLWVALAGCGYVSKGEIDDRVDADRDGFPFNVEGEIGDCDDNNAQVHGPMTFHADTDEDGYGDPEVTRDACIPPMGFVLDATDCDDSDATVHPDAGEICDGQVNNCSSPLPGDETDDDGDGWVECTVDDGGWDGAETKLGDDCDDTDATIHPTATELCDGLDNDCDDAVPSDETDDDSDGWVECTLDAGGWDATETKLGDDCDDTDDTVHPTATELCDGLDNDCDDAVPGDETDDEAAGGDGYVECTLDAGGWDATEAKLGDDCDDANAAVYPGAPAVCDDGVINDCDATVECALVGTLSVTGAHGSVVGTNPDGHVGTSLAVLHGWSPDPCPMLVVGAPAGAGAPGRAIVVDSVEQTGECGGSGERAWFGVHQDTMMQFAVFDGPIDSEAGASVASLGDWDGGGTPDLLIGAPGEAGGAAYLVLGEGVPAPSPPIDLTHPDNDGFVTRLAGGDDATYSAVDLGAAALGPGDWATGTGGCATCADLVVGDPGYSGAPSGLLGAVFIARGHSTPLADVDLTDVDYGTTTLYTRIVSDEDDALGSHLAGGADISGDGVPDVVIGAIDAVTDPVDAGRLFVIIDSPGPGDHVLADLVAGGDAIAWDAQGGEAMGPVAVAGEVFDDANDTHDLVVGFPGRGSGAGQVVVVEGGMLPPSGDLVPGARIRILGDTPGDELGDAVAAGDIDGDGLADIAVTAPGAGSDAGAVLVFFGEDLQLAAQTDLGPADAGLIVTGEPGDQVSTVLISDLNADGYDELIIGAPGHTVDLDAEAGGVFIFFHRPD